MVAPRTAGRTALAALVTALVSALLLAAGTGAAQAAPIAPVEETTGYPSRPVVVSPRDGVWLSDPEIAVVWSPMHGADLYRPYAERVIVGGVTQTGEYSRLLDTGGGSWHYDVTVWVSAYAQGGVVPGTDTWLATEKTTVRVIPHRPPREEFVRVWPDVPRTHPFFVEQQWMKDVARGYPDGTFRPAVSVKREALAAFLYRIAGSPNYTPPTGSPFRDVPPTAGWPNDPAAGTHPFYKEIMWAYSNKIITGYSGNVTTPYRTFRPANPVSREAAAAMMFRTARLANPESQYFVAPTVSPFTDVPTSHPFYREITWMAATGISRGYPDGTFRPSSPVLRDAMVAFLYRFGTTQGAWKHPVDQVQPSE